MSQDHTHFQRFLYPAKSVFSAVTVRLNQLTKKQ